jgi:hypothetical protein
MKKKDHIHYCLDIIYFKQKKKNANPDLLKREKKEAKSNKI